jgi:hypothetical protein
MNVCKLKLVILALICSTLAKAQTITLAKTDAQISVKVDGLVVSNFDRSEFVYPFAVVTSPNKTMFYLHLHKYGKKLGEGRTAVVHGDLPGLFVKTKDGYIRHELKTGNYVINDVAAISDGPEIRMLARIRSNLPPAENPAWRWVWLKWQNPSSLPAECAPLTK